MTISKWPLDVSSGNMPASVTSTGYARYLTPFGIPEYKSTSPSPKLGSGYLSVPTNASLRVNADAQEFLYNWTDGLYFDAYFYLETLPTSNKSLFIDEFYYAPSGLGVTTTGAFALLQGTTVMQTTASGVVPTGEWFRVSVQWQNTGSYTGLWKNASLFLGSNIDGSTPDHILGNVTSNASFLRLCAERSTTMYIDDIVIGTYADGPYTRSSGSSYNFEGTPGAIPGPMTGTYGTSAIFIEDSDQFALSSTQKIAGNTSGRVNSTTIEGNLGYSPPDSIASAPLTSYFRGYFYLTAAPTTDFALDLMWANGFTKVNGVLITTSRKLAIVQNSTKTISGTGEVNAASATNSIPLNEWFRLEAKITTSQVTAKVWTTSGAGVHSTGTPDISLAPSASTVLTDLSGLYMGYGTADPDNGFAYTAIASGQYMYMDEFAMSTGDWIGPVSIVTTYKGGYGMVHY